MKSENGNSLAVSHCSRWLWPCAPATATHQTYMQAILKPRKSSWQLKPTLAMKGTWWQLKLGRALGAVQVCMEAVNGEARGGRHRGHMEKELATQGTCGSVTQYDASSHANRSVCDCVLCQSICTQGVRWNSLFLNEEFLDAWFSQCAVDFFNWCWQFELSMFKS